jgi:hypothetical protein
LGCRLERCAEDDEGRTFEIQPGSEPSIANSTELRSTRIDMLNESGKVVQVRRSKRANAQPPGRANMPPPKPIKHVLPIESEAVIRDACW